jgi:hypothetical protein
MHAYLPFIGFFCMLKAGCVRAACGSHHLMRAMLSSSVASLAISTSSPIFLFSSSSSAAASSSFFGFPAILLVLHYL